MSAPFLTTTVADMLVAVEAAFGADLTDLTGASWTWSDITADVLLEDGDGISITLGRPDFSSETQTAEMVCELDNRDGEWSGGGLSPHWPHLRRGTPIRARVSDNSGTNWYVRFQGGIVGLTPHWDKTGRWATATLTASAPLRRLNQGSSAGISAMREGTLSDSSVKAYWPCEDRQHSTLIAPAVGTVNGAFLIYNPATGNHDPGAPGECASYADIPSSGPLVTLVEGGNLVFDNLAALTSTASTVSGLFGNVTNIPPYDGVTMSRQGFPYTGVLLTVYTENAASIKTWELAYDGKSGSGTPPAATPGQLKLRGYSTVLRGFNTDVTFSSEMAFNLKDNTPYTIGLMLSQSGSTTTWQVYVREVGDTITSRVSNTRSSNSTGAQVTNVEVGEYDGTAGLAVGHIAVRNIAPIALGEFDGDEEWMNGHVGESPTGRLTRLCETHGIPITVLDDPSVVQSASITDTMGPQFYDTLTNLLRECEATGQGVLYDGLGPGLTYVTKRRRESNANGPASLVIDASAAQLMEPFAPVDDDQLTINHVEVTRRGGTTQVYERASSIAAIGEYGTSLTVNPSTDSGLRDYAEWLTNIGTEPGYRYPSVSFALETNPSLIAGWLDCTPQSRIDITNVTAVRRQHPSETIKLLVEGWQEEITAFTWRVTANTTSALPWNVIELAAATGSTGDAICHLGTDDSQLNADAAAGATSISVKTNSGPRWVTTSEDSDSFPFDLSIGGVKATVTGITSTTSPQTFTLSAGLPRAFTGSTTAGVGTPVQVWQQSVTGF